MMISLESTLEDDATIEALESDEIHIELVNYVYDLRKLNHILTILSGETDQDIPEAIKSLPEIEILRQINTAADRKSTRLNSSHVSISYAVFCLKKKISII